MTRETNGANISSFHGIKRTGSTRKNFCGNESVLLKPPREETENRRNFYQNNSTSPHLPSQVPY